MTGHAVDDGLPSAAARLLAGAGVSAPIEAVIPLPGGRNNRVYRVEAGGGLFLFKRYFAEGEWNRLTAESRFLRFCETAGIECVPRLLAEEGGAFLALHEWLPGAQLRRECVNLDYARRAAADFFCRLASASRLCDAPPPARDACLCLEDYLRSPRERMRALEESIAEGGKDGIAAEAGRFVHEELRPAWDEAAASILRALRGKDLLRPFDRDALIYSPSDFGFHNALALSGGRVGFVDFEYAGLDDPAKAMADFVCQPSFPSPPEALTAFSLDGAFGPREVEAVSRRAEMVLPLTVVKMCCIILNDFKTADDKRRAFARTGEGRARRESQLAKAKVYLRGYAGVLHA